MPSHRLHTSDTELDAALEVPKRRGCGRRLSARVFSLVTYLTLPFALSVILLACVVCAVAFNLTRRPYMESFRTAHDTAVRNYARQISQMSERVYQSAVIADAMISARPFQVESAETLAYICGILDAVDTTAKVRRIMISSVTNETLSMCAHRDKDAPSMQQMDGFYSVKQEVNATYIIAREDGYVFKQPLQEWNTSIINTVGWGLSTLLSSHTLEVARKYWAGEIDTFPKHLCWNYRSSVNNAPVLFYPIRTIERMSPRVYGAAYFAFTHDFDYIAGDLHVFDASLGVPGIRVLGLDDESLADGDPIVLANNWGQPALNDTNSYSVFFTAYLPKRMLVSEVTDPLMRSALEHVNLKEMLTVGYRKTATFTHKGTLALVTAWRDDTVYGRPFALVVATPCLASRALSDRKMLALVSGALAAVSVLLIIGFAWLMGRWLARPLQEMAVALDRSARTRQSGRARVRRSRWVCIREVDELAKAYNAAMAQLEMLDTFVPQRAALYACPSAAPGAPPPADSVASRCRTVRVTCVSVRTAICDRTSKFRCPAVGIVTAYLDALYRVGEETRGLIVVQDPGRCLVFYYVDALEAMDECGARGVALDWDSGVLLEATRRDAMRAMRFAFELQSLLQQDTALQRHPAHFFVETGMVRTVASRRAANFQQQLFFCFSERSICEDVGYLQPLLKVRVCLTEETYRLVQEHVRAIPLEALYAGVPSLDEYGVVLYEALRGAVYDAAWLQYATHFCTAFGCMLRGEYCRAMDEFDAIQDFSGADAGAQCGASTQLERLMGVCVEKVLMNDEAPYVRRPASAKFLHLLHAPLDRRQAPRPCSRDGVHSADDARASRGIACSSGASPADQLPPSAGRTTTVPVRGGRARSSPLVDQHGNLWSPSFTQHCKEKCGATSHLVLNRTGTLAFAVRYLLRRDTGCLGADGAASPSAQETIAATPEPFAAERLFPATLMSDHTVAFLGYSLSVADAMASIVEYYPGGSLREMMSRYGRVLPTPAIIRYTVSILRGLQFLHGKGVVHGGLRPETVLVGTEGRCKLTGFFGDYALAQRVLVLQTSSYMSPGVARGCAASPAGDVYCAGLVLVEMMRGRSPWRWAACVERDRSPAQLEELVRTGGEGFAAELSAGHVEVCEMPEEFRGDPILCTVYDFCTSAGGESRCVGALMEQLQRAGHTQAAGRSGG